MIADSTAALRVLETSHPPTIYVPPADIAAGVLTPGGRRGRCASGRAWRPTSTSLRPRARGVDLPGPRRALRRAARPRRASTRARMDACCLDDERVQAQEGDFYGGWITADLVARSRAGRGRWAGEHATRVHRGRGGERPCSARRTRPRPRKKAQAQACATRRTSIVVGAGLAGLQAARSVVAAGKSVVVVEARGRVGGRTLNADVGGGKVVEVGGQWVGPTQDRLLALAEDLERRAPSRPTSTARASSTTRARS